jgi:hypothetical protein
MCPGPKLGDADGEEVIRRGNLSSRLPRVPSWWLQSRSSSDHQWIATAQAFGYAEPLLKRAADRSMKARASSNVDANDKTHLVLRQEMAPAMVAHYLIGTGWGFGAWDPGGGAAEDVDLVLRAPDGSTASLQVKAPDQPGNVAGRQRVDGEYDERVLIATDKAGARLPQPARGPAFAVLCAQ